VDQKVQELVSSVGQIGDARLLVMASLLISDELSETYLKFDSGNNDSEVNTVTAVENAFAQSTEILANRIELIAEKLEPA
jgi:cell division protein ZapA